MAHTPRNQSEKATLAVRRAWCYLVLVLISFLCLFFFYVLIINSTRTHFEIQKGFSLLPGKSLITNFQNVLADANIPVIPGIRNSLIVSACSAAFSVYFSALTAYGIYAYNFNDGGNDFKNKRLSLNRAVEIRSYLMTRGYKNFGIKIVNTDNRGKQNTVEVFEQAD